jgi:signal transduction histidine kinase
LGLVGVLVPLLVLLAVSAVSDESQTQSTDTADGVVTERTRGLSPWVPITAAALALPAAAAAWWWAGRAVAPIERITEVANAIQATSLDRRIGLTDAPDEVQALADSFDLMLDRLAASAQVQRRLVEDASHQLRTPLAVLATNADVALAEPSPTVVDLREALVASRATVDRLQGVVDDLLATARADHHAATGVDDLARIARDTTSAHLDLARALGVELTVSAPDRLPAAVDGASVARAVSSLVENALRHSPAGGVVEVTVGEERGLLLVSVSDQGPGIDPADRERIFERYWSGAPTGDGLGIGLAVVKQVADGHEGVEVESPLGPEGGTRFTLHFRRDARAGGANAR